MPLSTPLSPYHDGQAPSGMQALRVLQENLWLLPTPGPILKHLLCILNHFFSVCIPSWRIVIRKGNVFFIYQYIFLCLSQKMVAE